VAETLNVGSAHVATVFDAIPTRGILIAILAITLHCVAVLSFYRMRCLPGNRGSGSARFGLAFAAALSLAAAASASEAMAQSISVPSSASDCEIGEPDSVQISWDRPCEDGTWLMDTEQGCRMWDWHPGPSDRPTWSGACPARLKSGTGVLQWYEHGQPIDRFEGEFIDGRRQGFGRYFWNESEWFLGFYKDGVPDGPGSALIAGEAFFGTWRRGCLSRNGKVVAINVTRASCEMALRLSTACRGS
jgi:hypothetical protein